MTIHTFVYRPREEEMLVDRRRDDLIKYMRPELAE